VLAFQFSRAAAYLTLSDLGLATARRHSGSRRFSPEPSFERLRGRSGQAQHQCEGHDTDDTNARHRNPASDCPIRQL